MAEIIPMMNERPNRLGCGCVIDHGRTGNGGRASERRRWRHEVECELDEVAEEGDEFFIHADDAPDHWGYLFCESCGLEAAYPTVIDYYGAIDRFCCYRCAPMAEVLHESFSFELDLGDRMISVRP